MKICKISKFGEVVKKAIKKLDLPNNFSRERGSCMLATEILVKKLINMGRDDFSVIEGYVTFPTVDWKEQHTWIEMDNGEIIDKTSNQWGIKNIIYLRNRRKSYTPKEYLELCSKYPVENPEKYLGNFEYLGKCTDGSCMFDATEVARIIDSSAPFDIEGIYPFLSDELKIKIKNNLSEIESGINNNIVWINDGTENIRYFYKKL